MARRRVTKKEQRALGTLILLALGAGLLGSIAERDWETIGGAAAAIGLAIVGLIALIILMRALIALAGAFFTNLAEKRALSLLSQKVFTTTERHMNALVRRRRQLVQSDAYGHAPLDAWIKETIHFMNTQIVPQLSEAELRAFTKHSAKVAYMIESNVKEQADATGRDLAFFDSLKPRDYEHLCADFLREAGWDARVTTHSRDFGVDVIAEKSERRLVVQCKMYTKPVGIKAVQEIVAGRIHEQAHLGLVVSNQRFTSAAIQMAATNDILLLHHEDLRRIDELVGITSFRLKGVMPSDAIRS